jgi:hypothetical protein
VEIIFKVFFISLVEPLKYFSLVNIDIPDAPACS